MATTNDIYAEMQRYAPLELAESWDNPGLLVDCGREVSRVLVTLDITPEVVEEAAAGGYELIVSHHPVIFSPLRKLTPGTYRSSWCKRASLPSVCTPIWMPPRAA